MHKKLCLVESTLVLNDDYDNRGQITNDRKGIKNDILVTALTFIAIELTTFQFRCTSICSFLFYYESLISQMLTCGILKGDFINPKYMKTKLSNTPADNHT